MKQITCSQMGGPVSCNYIITGNTAEEMVKNGMNHVIQSHPDMAEQIHKMTSEETTNWMVEFNSKFNSLSEV